MSKAGLGKKTFARGKRRQKGALVRIRALLRAQRDEKIREAVEYWDKWLEEQERTRS